MDLSSSSTSPLTTFLFNPGKNTIGRSILLLGTWYQRIPSAPVLGMEQSKLYVCCTPLPLHFLILPKWSPQRPTSILTLPTHSCTYSSAFSPHSPSILSSVTSDSHLRIFDLRTPASASNHLVQLIPIHGAAPAPGQPQRQSFPPSECLTHDWNKYRPNIIATGGVDTIIRTFDIRQPRAGPLALLQGHEYAVRKLAWSPHLSDVLLSASYDMTCRVWSDGTSNQSQTHPGLGGAGMTQGREIGQMGRHTEFCTGVDWCMFGAEGWCATVSWDKRLLVWDVRAVMGQS